MATRGSELVRPHIYAGTLAEVEKELQNARQRGMLRGEQYTVARLKDGRYAVKVWLIGYHEPVTPKWRMLTPGQTWAVAGALAFLAFVATVLWMIVHTFLAVGQVIADHARPIVGGLIVLGLVALLARGGGGGGTFTGTFRGTLR